MDFSSSSFCIILKISMTLSSIPFYPSYLIIVAIKEIVYSTIIVILIIYGAFYFITLINRCLIFSWFFFNSFCLYSVETYFRRLESIKICSEYIIFYIPSYTTKTLLVIRLFRIFEITIFKFYRITEL